MSPPSDQDQAFQASMNRLREAQGHVGFSSKSSLKPKESLAQRFFQRYPSPKALVESLDDLVIGQHKAKKVLATTICSHIGQYLLHQPIKKIISYS
ncbi:MAG: hypothetical protein OXC92_02480 [Flavobacteriaceae bacterium]|nr:hypothetical protein [Flavobacteriaceae bacterium]MCY4215834.1 hypothetical protein [Flavobacteriaceae bacterium]MCY4253969.1 hypothetical protein [Flavobacteriaceae bacterium]